MGGAIEQLAPENYRADDPHGAGNHHRGQADKENDANRAITKFTSLPLWFGCRLRRFVWVLLHPIILPAGKIEPPRQRTSRIVKRNMGTASRSIITDVPTDGSQESHRPARSSSRCCKADGPTHASAADHESLR